MTLRATPLLPAVLSGVVATVVLFLVYTKVPLFGMPAGILAPYPALYFSFRGGRQAGYIIALASAVLLLAIDGPQSSLIYLVQAGVLSVVLGECLARGFGGTRSIAMAVLGNVAIILFLALALYLGKGLNLHGEILKGIDASIGQTVKLYEAWGVTGDTLASMREALKKTGRILGEIYPSLALVVMGIVAALNLQLLKKAMPEEMDRAGLGSFEQFKNPDHLVWLLIAAGFALLLPQRLIGIWAMNVLIAVLTLYFMQGLAVMVMLMRRFALPALLRFMFYLLLIFQPYLVLLVAAIGLFDLWGDFRTPRNTENL